MEKKLKSLFEFQRFSGNSRIEKMAAEAEAHYGVELSDSDLESVAAAGDLLEAAENPENKE